MSHYTCVPAPCGRRCITHANLPLFLHDDRCCPGFCELGREGHCRAREHDARNNSIEPDGSYGLCWKRVVPEDPATHRCVLRPEHSGECSSDLRPDLECGHDDGPTDTKRYAAVSLIERADGRLLCVWNRRYVGWALPGGLVEKGETVEDGLARELREETSLEVVTATLVFQGEHQTKATTQARAGRASDVCVFRVTASGEPKAVEDGCPFVWLTREEFLSGSPFAEFYRRVFAHVARTPHAKACPSSEVEDALRVIEHWAEAAGGDGCAVCLSHVTNGEHGQVWVDELEANIDCPVGELRKLLGVRPDEPGTKSEKCGALCIPCRGKAEDAAPSECICHWCLIGHLTAQNRFLIDALEKIRTHKEPRFLASETLRKRLDERPLGKWSEADPRGDTIWRQDMNRIAEALGLLPGTNYGDILGAIDELRRDRQALADISVHAQEYVEGAVGLSSGPRLDGLRSALDRYNENNGGVPISRPATLGSFSSKYDAAQKVGPYRAGRKLGRTLYRDEKCIGMVDDEESARFLAGAANYYLQQVAPLPEE